MRNILSAALLLAIIFFTSCKTPYFNSVNNMRQINSTVYLKDGKQISGQTNSSLVSSFNSNSYISIKPDNSGGLQKVYLTDIKGIEVRSNYYEPKLIDMGFGSRDQLLFVKRMTKPDSKIGLYELYEQRQNTSYRRGGGSYTYYTDNYSYYISFAGNKNGVAWSLDGKHLTPNFEDKMSEIVKDCPALAEKIKSKEKGYFYAQVSLISEKRIETMLNIIDEYNKCK